jgi:hypothetical protein
VPPGNIFTKFQREGNWQEPDTDGQADRRSTHNIPLKKNNSLKRPRSEADLFSQRRASKSDSTGAQKRKMCEQKKSKIRDSFL